MPEVNVFRLRSIVHHRFIGVHPFIIALFPAQKRMVIVFRERSTLISRNKGTGYTKSGMWGFFDMVTHLGIRIFYLVFSLIFGIFFLIFFFYLFSLLVFILKISECVFRYSCKLKIFGNVRLLTKN